MITKAIILLSKIGVTKRILKVLAWVFFGLFLLFGTTILVITGMIFNAVGEFGQNEIERQEAINEYTINGGAVQNPKSDYEDNEVPKEFEDLYKNIADKYNVDWKLLAAIHRVETAFSSNNTKSSAGAIGHTQFMPCTWVGFSYPGCSGGLGNADISEEVYTDPDKIKKYGGEGVDGNGNGSADPNEISDALSATAKKLEKDRANEDIESAIFNYNRSNEYVDTVLKHYNAYKEDIAFVDAGIDDIADLGKTSNGEGMVVGDMALPLDPHFFTNSMTGGIGSYEGHPGYDFAVPMGTPVYSLVDGEVIESVNDRPNQPPGLSLASALSLDDLGNYIRIRPDNNPDLVVNYMHLNTKENNGNLVSKGDRVEKGELIGKVGNSGKTTNPHLHLDVLINNNYSINSAIHWYDDLLEEFEKNSED